MNHSKLKVQIPRLDYSISTYTDEQKAAIDEGIKFVNPNNPKVHLTIEGPGGTGKTTIVKDILKLCNVSGKKVVTAPTHKAVRVVSKASSMRGVTIHKLLGLRPNTMLEHFNPNKPMFGALGTSTMAEHAIVVIDEASMINKYLHDKLIKTAERAGTKIIFIGDDCQLPPVNERLSLVFQGDNVISLTRVMRQGEDNPLIPMLNTLRRDVKLGSSYVFTELRKNPKLFGTTGGYYKQNSNEYIASMDAYFNDTTFTKDTDFVRATCHTNNAVSHWNQYIRRKLFPDVTEVLCKDDFLMSYSTIVEQHAGDKIVEIMFNSEDYIIKDFNRYVNDQGLNGYLISLQAVSSGDITPYMFVVDHKDTNSLARYTDIVRNYKQKAERARNAIDRRLGWQEFTKYRSKNLCMVDIYEADNKTLITSKDLDYGFALTVHNTQGSTYGNIFVDGNNIIYNKFGAPVRDIKVRNRLLYVALSRPTTNAFININI